VKSNKSVIFSIIFAALSIFLSLSCGLRGSTEQSSDGTDVEAIPINLDPQNPDVRRVGTLTYLAGFELRSTDPRFGGLSGLALTSDGNVLYAISDRGYWLRALLRHDSEGRLAAISGWSIGRLLTPEGDAVSGLLIDAEGLAFGPDGSFIVSFERVHRLWRYPPPPVAFSSPARSLPVPADLDKAPNNGGIEGVTVLPDGRLLIITEEYRNPDGSVKGWLIRGDRFEPLSYLSSEGFSPTDLAPLSNGDVLLLERRYSPLSGAAARIQILSAASIQPGSQLKGKEIARLERPLVVDNFEGMAVREDPKLGTFIYLISDDNYSPLQRTLLLQFRLERDGGNSGRQ
jgi:hypothetical protein